MPRPCRSALTAALIATLALSACIAPAAVPPPDALPPDTMPLAAPEAALSPAEAARNFGQVVRRMEPVTEAACRATPGARACGFQIIVDTTPGAPANAYQTRDNAGQPVIAFTLALIAEARNADELAFVMGHESAHHILDHIPRERQQAALGGAFTGVLAAALGGDPGAIRTAQEMGASVAARSYSKDFELEADQLGAVLAYRAGFDPVRGAGFFNRLPDPGDSFLGTHPPNAQRIELVRQTVARLQAAG